MLDKTTKYKKKEFKCNDKLFWKMRYPWEIFLKFFSTFSVIILLDHLNNSNQLTHMGGA